MKRSIALLLAVILLMMGGCGIQRAELPPQDIFTVPEQVESSPLAQALMEAVTYALADYVGQETVLKPIEYISWKVADVTLLSQQEREAVEDYMTALGVSFDTRGTASGRSLSEWQRGIEMEAVLNPADTYTTEDYDLIIQVKCYNGAKGSGYFAYFKTKGGDYILTECRAWESYTR